MDIPLNSFKEWLGNKNLKERTIENYLYYFVRFKYPAFNQESVSKFLASKSNRNTIARSFLLNLQKFLTMNYKELGISKDARIEISEVELPKLTGRTKQKIINPIPHTDIPLIEQALATERSKLKLLTSYYGGLRLQELLKITVISFNWETWKKDTSSIGECKVSGKGAKEGIALLPADLMKRIAIYIRSEPRLGYLNAPLFIDKQVDQLTLKDIRNYSRTWQMELRKAGIKSGVTKLGADGKPIKETVVHPHRLRHSWLTHLIIDLGLDIREAQEIARHSSIQSTQIYTHINKDHLKKRLLNSG